MCPACREALSACLCKLAPARPVGDGVVRVSREVQGRKGKAATVVRGLPLNDADIAEWARKLKAACGSGGMVKDGVIEVQGEHRDKLTTLLAAAGFTVKRVGG